MPEINQAENPQLAEIVELERQLAAKKAAMSLENRDEQFERQAEISRENVAEAQAPAAPAPSAPKPAQAQKQKDIEQDARSIAAMDEARKIETLVIIALEKGIMHCIEVAAKLQDPYILDTLHDKLIGELHERLVNENKLKEI